MSQSPFPLTPPSVGTDVLDPRLTVPRASTDTSTTAVRARRQRAVESLGVQVDVPEERFDLIVRIAHHVFDVPMATITVIDGQRALFPGSYGLDLRTIGSSGALCSLTLTGDVVVIEDLREDPVYSGHPALTDFGIISYVGRPLRDPFGNVVGTLALYDRRPRELTPSMLGALDDLAAWAQQELVASGEMVQAARVQASLQPAEPLQVGDWTFAGRCLPSLAVGGDFFDYQVQDGVARLGLGDVMGKGTGAALVCAGVRGARRGTAREVARGADLGASTTALARRVHPDLAASESFATLFDAVIDLEDGAVRYVDAGCGLCVVVRVDGTVEWIHGEDGPLGVLADDAWTEHRTALAHGDRMLVFSDGLLDLLDGRDEWWREVGALVAVHDRPDDLLTAVTTMSADRTALDDVTVVAVYRGAAT